MQVSTCVLDVQAPIRYHGNLGSNMHMWYHPTVCRLKHVHEVGNGDKLCARGQTCLETHLKVREDSLKLVRCSCAHTWATEPSLQSI